MGWNRNQLILMTVGILAGMVLGILIGALTARPSNADSALLAKVKASSVDPIVAHPDIVSKIIDGVDVDKIRENLREFSRLPHLAGQRRDAELARLVKNSWTEAGFDSAKLVPYRILLSYPDPEHPNTVRHVDDKGEDIHVSVDQEEELRPGETAPNFVRAFNAYSPSGQVSGDLVYVNYARKEDFDELEKLGVSVRGKICIARYGKLFRGNKVAHAAERGAKGVILYSDPADIATAGVEEDNVYPNTWWLPGTGMQRGNVILEKGDPETPGWPSIDGVYRVDVNETSIPKIPCQPIGYEDARHFLGLLGGPPAPAGWKGGIANINYRVGPGFGVPYDSHSVILTVNNRLRRVISFNVIGQITGALEPDRYVIVGNHRDAWGFGALDPSSGTAGIMELARVLGELVKNGWRPRRSIIFASWGAEEYGLMGSTEWVEDKVRLLNHRAVAYINVDICVIGPYFSASASPLLWNVIREATKSVDDPLHPDKSVFEAWKERGNVTEAGEPVMKTLGSGSDHAPFAFYAGVPGTDIFFDKDKSLYNMKMYPSYHTGYETFYYVEKFIDPDFTIHRSCSQVVGVLARLLADSRLIPFSLLDYASAATKALQELQDNEEVRTHLQENEATLDGLAVAVGNFSDAATAWHTRLDDQTLDDPVTLRVLNDQLTQLESAFLLPEGLPNRPRVRHALFAPSKYDNYATSGFPGIADLLYNIKSLRGNEALKRRRMIQRHISDLVVMFHQASDLLRPLDEV